MVQLKSEEREQLLVTLQKRFEANMHRHENLTWEYISSLLRDQEQSLQALLWMEQTGGEPDVLSTGDEDIFTFTDFAKETPKERRGVCYDESARLARKKFPPEKSVESYLIQYDIQLLSEQEYRAVQAVEPIDEKTSSWIATPSTIRQLGGALFGDRRYNSVFVYHNGADSYYGSRGFRVKVLIQK